MALIKCSECGKEISDKAAACPNCGCPISEINATPINSTPPVEQPVVNISQKTAKKKNKTLPFIITGGVIVIAIIAIFISGLIGGEIGNESTGGINNVTDGKITGGTEAELAIIIDVLSLTRQEVLSVFPNAENEETKIIIPGTFAGSNGIYKAFISSGGNDVYQMIFERDSDNYDSDAAVEKICDCLGKYSEYDVEWNKYEWYTDELELLFYVDERIYFYETDSKSDNNSNIENETDETLNSIQQEIEFVVNLFYQKKSAVLSDYPNATEDNSNVLIEGTFAGMNGTYNICTMDGKVYKVLFIRNDGVDVTDDIIDTICECLGDYIEYDEEWNKYEWSTNKLELALYADERIYFEPAYEDFSNDDSSNQGGNDNASKKLTDSEIEDLAVQTLYKQLLAYENNYHNIDAASCRYEINKIVRDDGSVEVYGTVWFYDIYGSITKFGSSYSSGFTIHMTEWGTAAWCDME